MAGWSSGRCDWDSGEPGKVLRGRGVVRRGEAHLPRRPWCLRRTQRLLLSPTGARPRPEQLNGVWGPSASDVVAVGDFGQILRTVSSGASWSTASSGTKEDLAGVCGGGGKTFAVGARGTLLESADGGATWSALPSGTTNDLTHCAVDGATLYVAGSAGTIIALTP